MDSSQYEQMKTRQDVQYGMMDANRKSDSNEFELSSGFAITIWIILIIALLIIIPFLNFKWLQSDEDGDDSTIKFIKLGKAFVVVALVLGLSYLSEVKTETEKLKTPVKYAKVVAELSSYIYLIGFFVLRIMDIASNY